MAATIPDCPSCKSNEVVMPARCLPRPESTGGKALGCAACGDGVPATREQVTAAERRERVWREAEKRKDRDDARGVHISLGVYVEQVEAEEDRRAAPAGEQCALPWGST
jgi:hypothetical protein